MLKRGNTKMKLTYDRNKDKVLVTCWCDGRLVDHGLCIVRGNSLTGDYFIFRGEVYYISEFNI